MTAGETARGAGQTRSVAGAVMPLVDHLAELRRRIIWSVLAIGVGGIVGFWFGEAIIAFLTAPLPANVPRIVTGLGDAFAIRIRIALVVGVILAMPVILWHVWRFVAPGLTPTERRAVLPWIPAALFFFVLGVSIVIGVILAMPVVLWHLWRFISPGLTPSERRTALPWIPVALGFFVIGVTIAYVILPFASAFLLGFQTDQLQVILDIRSYFDFVTTLFLAFGILMEFPILLVGLSRVGIVTSERLRRSRRFVILGIAIFSAVVTPGGDLVSPTVLGVTLYVLFEVTTFVIRRQGR